MNTRFKRILAIAGIVVAALLKLLLVIVVALFAFIDYFAPLSHTPLGEYTSADGKHVLSVYVSDGGATTPYTVVAEVRGAWIIGSRTIYAVDNIEEATVLWLNNRTVRINGTRLDIYRDKYTGDIYDLEDDWHGYFKTYSFD